MRRIKFKLKNHKRKKSTSYIYYIRYKKLSRYLHHYKRERKIWLFYLKDRRTEFHIRQVKMLNLAIKKVKKLKGYN